MSISEITAKYQAHATGQLYLGRNPVSPKELAQILEKASRKIKSMDAEEFRMYLCINDAEQLQNWWKDIFPDEKAPARRKFGRRDSIERNQMIDRLVDVREKSKGRRATPKRAWREYSGSRRTGWGGKYYQHTSRNGEYRWSYARDSLWFHKGNRWVAISSDGKEVKPFESQVSSLAEAKKAVKKHARG